MSLTSYELFNIWFPALVGALVVGLVVAALWDFVRCRFWLFVSRFRPNILREVGLDSQHQFRAQAEDHHREISEKLTIFARVMNLLVSPQSSNSGSTTGAFDVEAQIENNPHHATHVIHTTGTSTIEATYSINTSSENRMYPRETFQGVDCNPVTIIYTAYFPDGTPKDVTRPAKRLFKMHANGPVKRIKSSIILQASIAIDPWVLAEIVELAKHCIQKENRCIFQLGNWAILYYNASEIQLHLLKEGDVPVNIEARWQDGKIGIKMRGLYLTGSQVKVGTKRTSEILRSASPATQGVGDLDELHLPTKEFQVLGEDFLIYASKVVVVDGVSLILRSEASFILPPQEKNTLLEAVWTRCLRISNSAKKMLLSLFFGAEDCQPQRAANCPELEFDPEQLELNVQHWKGLSEIELLNMRKEVLLYLQELQASGTVERAGPPSPHSHLIFVRDEHYLECWQEGLRVLNEVIHRNSNDSHSHTHIRVRGGIQFLLGDFESALQDYDLAHLNTGGHQSTILLERALVKCKLGRYSEAMQDVVAVITLNPNVNDIQELRACIQQILDQQRAIRIVTQSSPSCQRPLLPNTDNAMVKIPDLLTGDEWRSGEIGSLCTISDACTAEGLAFDTSSKRAKSVGVTRATDWSTTSVAEALKLQLMITNDLPSLGMNPRYHVRRISCIVCILEDECDPDDVVKPLSTEGQEMLNWQAPMEGLQNDLQVRETLISLSRRLCPYKNISHTLHSNVTDDDSNVQRRGPHPLSCYPHVSFRSAMLTKHSAADGDVQTLFLYDGTPGDRSCWRWCSHDYIKELFLPEARSAYRAFWLVQWDVADMRHVVQGDPDRGLCSNPAAVEREDDLRKLHSVRWIADVTAAGTRSPTSDGNGLNMHRSSDARTNPRMSILVNEKSRTSRQTQLLRAPVVDRVFPTNSENSASGGDSTPRSTLDSSSMNAWAAVTEGLQVHRMRLPVARENGKKSPIAPQELPISNNIDPAGEFKVALHERKCVDNFHYHNGDEEAESEVLRSADTHRISSNTHRNPLELPGLAHCGEEESTSWYQFRCLQLEHTTSPDDKGSILKEWNQEDESQELKIENGLQVAVKSANYHDLSRSTIEQVDVRAGITHPDVCTPLHQLFRTGAVPATELMQHDLRSVIDSRLKGLPEGSTPFTYPVAVDIMHQMVDIMLQSRKDILYDCAHNVGHRDLKAKNILLTPLPLAVSGSAFRPEHYYSVKLADFERANSRIQFLDWETQKAGTSVYKATEMLEERELQRKTDVYSFGMICCEIVTGKYPFEEYRNQGLGLHARGPLDNLTLRDVPEALTELIQQCLDPNPALRPTFNQIVKKLRAIPGRKVWDCDATVHQSCAESRRRRPHNGCSREKLPTGSVIFER